MSAGPEHPYGSQWSPQHPGGGYGQPGSPDQGGQGQTQEQHAWQQPQARQQPQPPEWSPVQPGYQPAVMPKNPGVSLLLSFFIPGLGSIVSGNTSTGIIILVVWIAGLILSVFIIGVPVMFGAWIWGMVDGYKSAQNWNRAHGILS